MTIRNLQRRDSGGILTLIRVMLVATSLAVPIVVTQSREANAVQAHTFNMAGWKQAGSGVPADYVVAQAWAGKSFNGGGDPAGVLTQETCNIQRNRIVNGLNGLLTSGAYVHEMWMQRAYYNQSTCTAFGPAVFGLANGYGDTWTGPSGG